MESWRIKYGVTEVWFLWPLAFSSSGVWGPRAKQPIQHFPFQYQGHSEYYPINIECVLSTFCTNLFRANNLVRCVSSSSSSFKNCRSSNHPLPQLKHSPNVTSSLEDIEVSWDVLRKGSAPVSRAPARHRGAHRTPCPFSHPTHLRAQKYQDRIKG